MASVGAPRLLLLPALVTRSQAMPTLFGPRGHSEPGSPGGPFPFPAVVRPRRQTPRAPLAAKQGVSSLGCASLNSLPGPRGAASWPRPPCHILVGHLSPHPSAFSPASSPTRGGAELGGTEARRHPGPSPGGPLVCPALLPYRNCWARSRVSLPILAITESVLEFLKA